MANMLPSRIFPKEAGIAPGEEDIFDRLKDDLACEDWWVLHSYHIVNHVSQKEGEADFVIFVPNYGIAIVEIKSHKKIKIENGLWFLGDNTEPEVRTPLEQAQKNKWSMISTIKAHPSKPEDFKKYIWTHICIFPDAKFSYESSEWGDWQICDAEKLNKHPVSTFIIEALKKQAEAESSTDHSNKTPQIGRKSIEKMIKILRPNLESIVEAVEQREERINTELNSFTEEQEIVFRAAKINPTLSVTGPAGSGKTFLATEICNYYAKKSKKVIYLCFNRGLSLNLKNKFPDAKFEIKHFHSMLAEKANASTPVNKTLDKEMYIDDPSYTNFESDDAYWQKILVDKAHENLRETNEKYDVIVIDEFQDLAIEKYMYLIDRLLKGGLASGNWYTFGDFEKQNIFQKYSSSKEILQELGYPTFNLSLRRNCRNTPSSVERIEKYTKLDPPYVKPVMRSEGLTQPTYYLYENKEMQIQNLKTSVENMKATGYEYDEMLILSPIPLSIAYEGDPNSPNISSPEYRKSKGNVNVENGSAFDLGFTINEYNYEEGTQSKPGPYYTTIQKYKGLEFNVVILTDLDFYNHFTSKEDELTSLIYIGMTRALETNVLHVSNRVYESGILDL